MHNFSYRVRRKKWQKNTIVATADSTNTEWLSVDYLVSESWPRPLFLNWKQPLIILCKLLWLKPLLASIRAPATLLCGHFIACMQCSSLYVWSLFNKPHAAECWQITSVPCYALQCSFFLHKFAKMGKLWTPSLPCCRILAKLCMRASVPGCASDCFLVLSFRKTGQSQKILGEKYPFFPPFFQTRTCNVSSIL